MKLYQDPEWLRQRYYEDGLNTCEMAEEAECSVNSIRYWMDKFDMRRRGRGQTTEERFWDKVDVRNEDECWEWLASTRKGYGQFFLHGGQFPSHRIAWMLTIGDPPRDKLVCHHCDNPLCCNPAHLFLGTHQDNVLDAHRKGRAAPQYGEHNPGSRLTNEEVREIRHLCREGHVTHREIGERFGVARSTVSQIATYLNWGWLSD